MRTLLLLWLCAVPALLWAQQTTLRGRVVDAATGAGLPDVSLYLSGVGWSAFSGPDGAFAFLPAPYGEYTLTATCLGCRDTSLRLALRQPVAELTLHLVTFALELDVATVGAERANQFGMGRLRGVDGFAIYEGKKTEVIDLQRAAANLAANNARQIYARVPGLNIWESDGAGLQLGIGGRGLSPNRTANFNTRQNGYDISADALGYPESYYAPPAEALSRIELVRGAASLQYGTQFGGMLNFVFREGGSQPQPRLVTRHTGGSWGFYGTYTSLDGSLAGGKLRYFTAFQRRQGDGWRAHSRFAANTWYGQLVWQASARTQLRAEYTRLGYLARQPGGLTDAQFAANARQSLRARNWFEVHWNVASLQLDHHFGARTRLNVRTFGLVSDRLALGNLERINVADLGGVRSLIRGDFANAGAEARLLHDYGPTPERLHTLLVGGRLYRGHTRARQGDADAGAGATFGFTNPNNLEGSDFDFDNHNLALFAENIVRLGENLSLTPGLRLEYLRTGAAGYYKQRVFDFAGNVVVDTNLTDQQTRQRTLLLAGLGLSKRTAGGGEWYANWSENYRAINFNDLRIDNPNLRVDTSIRDERGFTADLGRRGNWRNRVNYDVSVFYLRYRDRIGQVLRADVPPLFLDYRYRTNISDARNLGLEVYLEADLLNLGRAERGAHSLLLFVNAAWVDARYVGSADAAVRGKRVELAPPLNLKSGLTWRYAGWQAALQWGYVHEHFTDATNARIATGAVNGLIPSYQVVDLSVVWRHRRLEVTGGVNNLLDARYFTRRAEAYPGPGIIPADGRGLYLGVGLTVGGGKG